MSNYSIDITGNLGREPSTRYTADGKPVITFSVAVTERQKDKGGQWGDVATHWFEITHFGDLACDPRKGDTVHVTAHVRTEKWVSKDGEPKQRTGFIADSIELTRRKGERSQPADDYGDLGPAIDMDELSPGD